MSPKQYTAYVVTTDSDHGEAVADNILNRQFTVNQPDEVWIISHITYIATAAGWAYLAVIIDLYSWRVIGWQLAEHMRAELVCQATQQAIARRCTLPSLFHSDRGSQYVSDDLEHVLPGVTLRMSRRNNRWDNAVAESFFGTLKREHAAHETSRTHHEAQVNLFQYIEGFYNRTRRHLYLGYIAPAQFEEAAA